MIKNNLGVVLTDCSLYLCSASAVYTEELPKGIIAQNKIAKPDTFYRYVAKILKKHKLTDTIMGRNIYILKFPQYFDSDVELITSIFEKLSFNKIKFIEYSTLIDNASSLYMSESSAIFTGQNKSYFLDYNIMDDIPKDLQYFLTSKLSNNDLFIFGEYTDIDALRTELEKKYNIKVFTYHNAKQYIITKLQTEIAK